MHTHKECVCVYKREKEREYSILLFIHQNIPFYTQLVDHFPTFIELPHTVFYLKHCIVLSVVLGLQ